MNRSLLTYLVRYVKYRPESGVALIEVLVASAVLIVGMIGIALMFSEGQSHVVAGGDDRVAVGLARDKIEAVRALGFGCIPVGGPGTAGVALAALTGCPSDAVDLQGKAARVYNETYTVADNPELQRYASRQTVVSCADPNTFAVQVTCPSPPTGKLIEVRVIPSVRKGRAIKVDTFIAVH